jgi:hypothetical protein
VHDFTGVAYGSVEGIAFLGGSAMAQVLLGRTATGNGYGSDVVFRNCNFAPPSRMGAMAFVNHMGEVITWRDCRFLGNGAPALLITWRAPFWNVSAPSGRPLATSVSLTVFRIDGGDFTGDNCGLLSLDTEGQPNAGCALHVAGSYFANTGDIMSAIEVRGTWRNVVVEGSRLEDDGGGPPVQHLVFLRLVNGALLQHFSIAAYGDGDATWPLIAGEGSLEGGALIGHGEINITVGDMRAVDITSAERVRLAVGGDVLNVRARSRADVAAADVAVAGSLELDDGRGGVIVHIEAVAAGGAASWAVDADGLIEAAFAGTRMLLHASSGGGDRRADVLSFRDEPAGQLALNGLAVSASDKGGAGGLFVVRRLTAA